MTPERISEIAENNAEKSNVGHGLVWKKDNVVDSIKQAIHENNYHLKRIINDLEYSAFNLLDGKKYTDLPHGISESTCPEKTLLIAIRDMINIIKKE